MQSDGEKITCLHFYFIVLISSPWNVAGETERLPFRFTGGQQVSLPEWVLGASGQMQKCEPCPAHEESRLGPGHSGGRGHRWRELDEGRVTCFPVEPAAWRRRGVGAGPRGRREGRGECSFRQRQSRMNKGQETGIPAQRAGCEAGAETLGSTSLF